MWNKILARMVQRAVSPFTDPDQERIAVEGAAAGFRYAATLIGIPALLLCLGVGALCSRLLRLPPTPPSPELVHTSRELGSENAQLRVAYQVLLKERDILLERLAKIETAAQRDPVQISAPDEGPVIGPTHASAPKLAAPQAVITRAATPVEHPLPKGRDLLVPEADRVKCENSRNDSECRNLPPPLMVEAPVQPPLPARMHVSTPEQSLSAVPNAPPVGPVQRSTALVQQIAPDPPYSR